ncbi:hypothetical protein [Neptunomonas marina]|uniref:Uncharacterized protein n=1 Tax=Neptunomonas marina TaxID=1815562 RepID=A0A437QDR8_9GAMM|nr:hypothetical protein [Neptunomonas marina]RVU32674.1 hypothetical protein EOE65_03190 [Neptunomonas marina]
MSYLVKVIDQDHELNGLAVQGSCIYYDIHHTGESPDLFLLEHEGQTYRVLSTQIDAEHYSEQLLKEEEKRLGFSLGDTVIITEGGSGSYGRDWDYKAPHKITKIDSSGHVEFDGGSSVGGASIFRPKVRAV